MAAAGAWVGMVARGRDAPAAAAAEVGGHAITGDVGEPAGVHALANYVSELLGDAPDVLVSCAGAFSLSSLAAADPEELERLLAVNLRGPFLLVRAFLPLMLRRRSGHLIHVGSVAGRVAFAENGAYSASKYGLRGMHEVLLQEIRGTGVRATLVEPAATDTALWDAIDPAAHPGLPPREAMLRAEDVARVVVFAASQPRHVQIPNVAVEAAG
jgi:NADP-dependent 3-hydroxy acid dehydrogenase YdfG